MKNSGKYRFLAVILALVSISGFNIFAQSDYQSGIRQWREKRENDLKSNNGWLTLTNLAWLKEGVNTVGSKADSDVKLPDSVASQVGIIDFKAGSAKLSINPGVNVLGDGQPVQEITLKSDAEAKPTLGRSAMFLLL